MTARKPEEGAVTPAERGSEPDLIYLSLGAGVQSSALYIMAVNGELGRVDCAIFADTQAEPKHVYEQLDRLEAFGAAKVPVHRVTAGSLHDDSIGGTHMKIPAFSLSERNGVGITRRQCTLDYKIAPIQKKVRSLLGLEPRQRAGTKRAVGMVGISMDEVVRMKPSKVPYIESVWPLVERRLYRRDCERIVMAAGFPMPKRSACYFCPFKSNHEWRDLRDNFPQDFARAVEFDDNIRDSSLAGLRGDIFLHRSAVPLRLAQIDDIDTAQQSFSWDQECEGMCGV